MAFADKNQPLVGVMAWLIGIISFLMSICGGIAVVQWVHCAH